MGGKVEDEREAAQRFHEFQTHQEHQMFQQHQQYNDGYTGVVLGGGHLIPETNPILPWSFPPIHTFNPAHFPTNQVRDYDHLLAPPSSSSSSYGGLYSRRAAALQLGYDGSSSDPLGLASLYIGSDSLGQAGRAGSIPFGLQAELGRMTAQELMDAKALAASKSHSEAERRRRERINKHLARLRSLLPSTTKTDKASLLAEVIQHVKELKRQTSEIAEASPLPTEVDELIVGPADEEDGRFLIKASLCCDDRSDLLSDLIKTLKALRLRTLKAEITTLGGRVKNVLLITGEEDCKGIEQHSLNAIQEALKAVMERTAAEDSSSGNLKRQRTNISILENRSI